MQRKRWGRFSGACGLISEQVGNPGGKVLRLPQLVMNSAQFLGYALNGWQVSGSVFWHSGVPFSVLSTPYSANGNGIVQGSGPQFASLVPGVDPYCRNCNIPGVTQPGTIQWLNPNAFVSAVDPRDSFTSPATNLKVATHPSLLLV